MFDRSRSTVFASGALLLGIAAMTGAGCSADTPKPETEEIGTTAITFEEFESRTYRDLETGGYVVEGDIRIPTRDALKAYFEKYVQTGALTVGTSKSGVTGDYYWNDIHKQALTYCVSTDFGANYSAVVAAMYDATAAWSNAVPVLFTHISSQDVACNSGNENVLFDVRPTEYYRASAFGPNSSRAYRNVLIGSIAFGDIAPVTLAGLLRHVLGHTLGFMHEHERPEAGERQCNRLGGWRPLTPYDSASVMHYPDYKDFRNCKAWTGGDLVLTQRDVEGAKTLYGRPPVRTNASQDGRIAVVSQSLHQMNVFWIRANGAITQTSWGSDYPTWLSIELAPPGSAAPRGSIAAVSRTPSAVDLFYVGTNGSIQHLSSYEGRAWEASQLAPAGSASTDGGMAVVSRIPSAIELWYIGADGSIQDKYQYGGGDWGGHPIAPPGSASIHGSIAAVSRVPTSMELWYIGSDGSIQDKNWYEGGNWGGFPLTGANAASLNGSIAAVSRVPTSMELWYIGADGSIQDKNWYEGGNWGGFPLTGASAASLNGSIAAVSRVANALELWYVGADGSIQDKNWYEGGNWSGFPLTGPNTASLNGSIGAVWRLPTSMELWFNGANGSVQDKYWYEGNPWSGIEIAPAGSAAQ